MMMGLGFCGGGGSIVVGDSTPPYVLSHSYTSFAIVARASFLLVGQRTWQHVDRHTSWSTTKGQEEARRLHLEVGPPAHQIILVGGQAPASPPFTRLWSNGASGGSGQKSVLYGRLSFQLISLTHAKGRATMGGLLMHHCPTHSTLASAGSSFLRGLVGIWVNNL